jgi:hypothetical protein
MMVYGRKTTDAQRTILGTSFVCRDCHETYTCVVGLPVHDGCRVGCEQLAVTAS